jgi:hypothetical protein
VNPVTSTLTRPEREIEPLIPAPVPVTVIVYAPGETVVAVNTVRVTLAELPEDNVALSELRVAPGPPETLATRVTVPLNPLRLVTVMREVADDPDGNVNVAGLAETLKSGAAPTVTVMPAEWLRRPLVAVTLIE